LWSPNVLNYESFALRNERVGAGGSFSVGVHASLQTVPSRTAMQVAHSDTAVDVLTRAGR